MTISHDDAVSAEKLLSSYVLVLQLLKRPAPTVFELHGSYWCEMKQNCVLYRIIEMFFFSLFELYKSLDLRKLKIMKKRNIIFKKS